MRYVDVINNAYGEASQLIDVSSVLNKSLAQAIQAANLHVANQPLAEEALADTLFSDETPEIAINAEVIEVRASTEEGQIVVAVSLPWFRIYEELEKNPEFLFQFVDNPRRFEEFIAGAYDLAGWNVTLTPRSGDSGRDVIAEKPGFGALRFLDQCKAYRSGRRVSATDVRAMLGVVSADPRANKGLVTTTSEFAPGIQNDPWLKPHLGNRIELKDGPALLLWLKSIVQSSR